MEFSRQRPYAEMQNVPPMVSLRMSNIQEGLVGDDDAQEEADHRVHRPRRLAWRAHAQPDQAATHREYTKSS